MPQINIPADLDRLIERQKAVFNEEAGGAADSFVVMGTGYLGEAVAERLRSFPVAIECFCDNNPGKQGTKFMGLPVLAVEDAVRKYQATATFVVAIFHSSVAQKQLRELGCGSVVTTATLCRHFGPPLIPLASIDYPTAIYKERAEVERCSGIWSDEKSRDEYAQVLNWFLADRQVTITSHDPSAETYFPPGLWQDNDREHFVDCGAFNGDSILFLLNKTGFKFQAATAYEPDPRNLDAFEKNMAALPEEHRRKVKGVHAAVGAAPGQVNFTVSGTAGSSVKTSGDLSVKCISLDEELHDNPPTFLKMDIEGYELEALTGARKLIGAHAPILAITTYHKVEHLWQIPLLLHSFRPDYRFYLRRYAEDCWETVCYAVPSSRAIDS